MTKKKTLSQIANKYIWGKGNVVVEEEKVSEHASHDQDDHGNWARGISHRRGEIKKKDGKTKSKLPPLSENKGKNLTGHIRDRLADAGLGRDSSYAGGENTGLTKSIGSTGFSVRDLGDELDFHVVISGKKAGVNFEEYTRRINDEEYNLHRPTNANKLNGRIHKVFTDMGFDVKSVKNTSHQEMWDDDLGYNIITSKNIREAIEISIKDARKLAQILSE